MDKDLKAIVDSHRLKLARHVNQPHAADPQSVIIVLLAELIEPKKAKKSKP